MAADRAHYVRSTLDNACVADAALILGLAGLGSTLTLGLAGPWLAARFKAGEQKRAFEHERTMRDEEELRRVLDDLMAAMDVCDMGMRAVSARHLRYGRKIGEHDEAHTKILELGEATLAAEAITGRLSLRLGVGHPLRIAAVGSINGVRRFNSATAEIVFMAGQADMPKLRDEIEAGQNEFSAARKQFVDLAVGFAGSRLPQQPLLEAGITDRPSPPAKSSH